MEIGKRLEAKKQSEWRWSKWYVMIYMWKKKTQKLLSQKQV